MTAMPPPCDLAPEDVPKGLKPRGYHWAALTVERVYYTDETETRHSTKVLPALVHECGFLAYHNLCWLDEDGPGEGNRSEEKLWFTVTHVPSGRQVCNVRTQAAAREVIGSLASLAGLAAVSPSLPTLSEARAAIFAVASRLHEAIQVRKKPTHSPNRSVVRSSFSPVHRPGPPPTGPTRLAANSAAVALENLWNGLPMDSPEESGTLTSAPGVIGRTSGLSDPEGHRISSAGSDALRERSASNLSQFYRTLDHWGQTAWREELMVRVTQPPNNHLLASDIPSSLPLEAPVRRAGQEYRLRDETPANATQFKVEYDRLLVYGDRLREGALRLLGIYAVASPDCWTPETLDRWERIDARFVSIVQEGWMVWSRAAYCLWASSDTFQAKVVAKLGHVGSASQGWAELGVKTLLRWPEVKEVQPLRREIREKRRTTL